MTSVSFLVFHSCSDGSLVQLALNFCSLFWFRPSDVGPSPSDCAPVLPAGCFSWKLISSHSTIAPPAGLQSPYVSSRISFIRSAQSPTLAFTRLTHSSASSSFSQFSLIVFVSESVHQSLIHSSVHYTLIHPSQLLLSSRSQESESISASGAWRSCNLHNLQKTTTVLINCFFNFRILFNLFKRSPFAKCASQMLLRSLCHLVTLPPPPLHVPETRGSNSRVRRQQVEATGAHQPSTHLLLQESLASSSLLPE